MASIAGLSSTEASIPNECGDVSMLDEVGIVSSAIGVDRTEAMTSVSNPSNYEFDSTLIAILPPASNDNTQSREFPPLSNSNSGPSNSNPKDTKVLRQVLYCKGVQVVPRIVEK